MADGVSANCTGSKLIDGPDWSPVAIVKGRDSIAEKEGRWIVLWDVPQNLKSMFVLGGEGISNDDAYNRSNSLLIGFCCMLSASRPAYQNP